MKKNAVKKKKKKKSSETMDKNTNSLVCHDLT